MNTGVWTFEEVNESRHGREMLLGGFFNNIASFSIRNRVQ